MNKVFTNDFKEEVINNQLKTVIINYSGEYI